MTALSDGHFDLPLAAFAVPPEVTPQFDPMQRLGAHAWLIETGTRTLLVDTGAGTALRQQFPATGQLPEVLATLGVTPDDITDIVITHLHIDHIGGLMQGGTARYPNAMLHMAAAEWRYWTAQDAASVMAPEHRPMARQITDIVASFAYRIAMHDGTRDLGDGIRTEPAPGHTPGHQIVHISDGSAQLLLLGDALMCGALQFERPGIAYALDANPSRAAMTRAGLFDRIAQDDIPFAATHLALGTPHRLLKRGRNRYEAVHNL